MLSRIFSLLQVSQQSTTKLIRMSGSVPKPPNILVQNPKKSSTRLLEKVQAVVSPTKYVVYPIETDQLLKTPWAKNTLLLILQERLKTDTLAEVVSYVNSGGKVLDFSANIELAAPGYVNIDSDVESCDTTELETVLKSDFEIETFKASEETDTYSYGYLVASSACLDTFFSSKRLFANKTLAQSKITLDFSSEKEGQPSENFLPVLNKSPPDFNSSLYLSSLTTTSLGQPLILVPVISSSMWIMEL